MIGSKKTSNWAAIRPANDGERAAKRKPAPPEMLSADEYAAAERRAQAAADELLAEEEAEKAKACKPRGKKAAHHAKKSAMPSTAAKVVDGADAGGTAGRSFVRGDPGVAGARRAKHPRVLAAAVAASLEEPGTAVLQADIDADVQRVASRKGLVGSSLKRLKTYENGWAAYCEAHPLPPKLTLLLYFSVWYTMSVLCDNGGVVCFLDYYG